METSQARRGRQWIVAAVVFVVTGGVFYLIAWEEGSPIFVQSELTLVVLAIAWVCIGVVLRYALQVRLGTAWVWGSAAFFVLYEVVVIAIAITYAS